MMPGLIGTRYLRPLTTARCFYAGTSSLCSAGSYSQI